MLRQYLAGTQEVFEDILSDKFSTLIYILSDILMNNFTCFLIIFLELIGINLFQEIKAFFFNEIQDFGIVEHNQILISEDRAGFLTEHEPIINLLKIFVDQLFYSLAFLP